MATKEEIAHFVGKRVQPVSPHYSETLEYLWAEPWMLQQERRARYTDEQVRQLARNLLSDAEFRSLELGAWLTTPDGQLIAEGVGIVLPPQIRPEYHLWVKAMQMAATMQQQEGKRRAAQYTLSLCLAGGATVYAYRSAA